MRRGLLASVGVLAALALVACTPAAPELAPPTVPVVDERVEETDAEDEPTHSEELDDVEAEPLPAVVESVPVEPQSESVADGEQVGPAYLPGNQGRLIVGDLNVPLKTMPVIEGVVNPPTYEDAYLVEGYGSPYSPGTAYVAMHSARGLPSAAGNALIDPDTQTSTVNVDDRIILDGVIYRVTEVRMVGKEQVVHEPGLWEQVDGRLVVFTCMQLDHGPSVDNVVIIAEA